MENIIQIIMKNISFILSDIIFILIFSFLIVFSAQEKKMDGFVKGLFIVSFSLRIITGIFDILSLLNIWQYWDHELSRTIMNSFYLFSFMILIYCLTLLIGKREIKEIKVNESFIAIKKRKIWISLLLFLIPGGIYFPFWLYRTIKDLNSNFKEVPLTPGKAVGFLFIPFFNIFWLFRIIFTLPLYVKRVEDKYYQSSEKFNLHPVLISFLWIFMIILSYSYLFQNIFRIDEYASRNEFSSFGIILACYVPSIFVWTLCLTIQAKINSFSDIPIAVLSDRPNIDSQIVLEP